MMRSLLRCKIIVVSLGSLVVAAQVARAQQEVGNGGDPVQLMFSKGRIDARTILRTFSAKAPGEHGADTFDSDVLDFLSRTVAGEPMPKALERDILDAPHLFFDPQVSPIVQSTCARTNLPDLPQQTIRFALPLCRNVLTEAGEGLVPVILIHEATHHFGVGGLPEDENFAWRVGQQLQAYWERTRDLARPHWSNLPLSGAPSARYDHASVALGTTTTQSRVFIWGGCNYSTLPDRESCAQFLNTGAILDVADGAASWSALPPAPVDGRRRPGVAAVRDATDNVTEVILWGGCNGPDASCDRYPKDGLRLDVAAGQWSTFSTPDGILGRMDHTLVPWTDGLLVYGGRTADQVVLGDAYLLSGSEWRPLAVPENAKGRFGHSTVSFGDQVIVFGGCAQQGLVTCTEYLNDGFVVTREGVRMLPPIPWSFRGRAFHGAAVVNRHMIVWGGQSGFRDALDDGAIYDFDKETWSEVPGGLLPRGESGRMFPQMSASAHGALVFGGQSGEGQLLQTVLQLKWNEERPDQQSWQRVETDTSPIGRKGHSQHRIPQGLVIWGGYGADQTFLPTGAVLKQMGD